ncbi:MAG: DsbA family protein [Pseudomonadota bacterium]
MRLFSTLFLGGLLAFSAVPAIAAEELPELSREQVEQIVREYLVENPEVVIEALQAYEQQMAANEEAQAQENMARLADVIYGDPEAPETGNPDGDVVIVEFFDYRCGYCRRAAPDLFATVADDQGIRLIYKEFPILGDPSVVASRAALAARNQGLYQPFHEALMVADIDFSEASIMALAESVGLDTEQLRADMDDPAIDEHLNNNYELARALGVRGTPAFIIGDELVPGAVGRAELEALVAEARGS